MMRSALGTQVGFWGVVVVTVCTVFCRQLDGAPGPTMNAPAGATCFVSAKGSDNAAGDEAHPFKTIAKALSAAKPGDTIRLSAGRYSEKVSINVSGTAGKPITIEGERGPKGEWLTLLDPSVPLTQKWVPAPEVSEGVYKMPFPGFEPFLMLVDGKFIPRVWPDHMADGEGFKKMAYPPDQTVKTYGGKMISYWDVMGAMYGCKDGTIYIRFRDRDDPNKKAIRIAPKGGGVEIIGRSWIVLRDLFVQGGQSGITIKGSNATHNVIENCRLVNASERIAVDGASYTTVRNNSVTAEYYSDKCQTGAWGSVDRGDAIPYELGLKYLFYAEYKMFFGPNGTSDYGIRLAGGTENEICGNRVSKGGQGIHVSQTTNVRIHDNTVEGLSSIGIIATLNKVVNVQIYDNLIMDSNIGCRIHHVNESGQTAPRSLYVYRNRFWQPPGVGSGVFFHYHIKNDADPYLHPNIYIYQNSFAGGRAGMAISAYADKLGGVPNAVVVNNIFANPQAIYAVTHFCKLPAAWTFDYNWLGGSGPPSVEGTRPPWYGPHNTEAMGKMIWDTSKAPDFTLPPDCSGRNAGLDLSKPFELAGKKFPPMPGMEPGYFKGPQPDMGAVQGK